MLRLFENTRVTLGTSLAPFWTSGSAAISLACSLPLLALKIASDIGERSLERTTELIGTRFVSLFRFGMMKLVWKVPIRPVSLSRTNTLIVHLPGRRVQPVEYSIGR